MFIIVALAVGNRQGFLLAYNGRIIGCEGLPPIGGNLQNVLPIYTEAMLCKIVGFSAILVAFSRDFPRICADSGDFVPIAQGL